RSEPPLPLSGSIFDARGGALALLRTRASDPEQALARCARELARLAHEAPNPTPQPVVGEDLLSAARKVGLEFASTSSGSVQTLQFGSALLLAGGSDAGPAAKAAQATTESARREHAQSVFERAVAAGDAHTRGDLDQYVAQVAADSGAHIDVQYTPGDAV